MVHELLLQSYFRTRTIRIVISVRTRFLFPHCKKNNGTGFPFSPFSTADYFPISIMLSSHFHSAQGFQPIWKLHTPETCCLNSDITYFCYTQTSRLWISMFALLSVLCPFFIFNKCSFIMRETDKNCVVRHCGKSISK